MSDIGTISDAARWAVRCGLVRNFSTARGRLDKAIRDGVLRRVNKNGVKPIVRYADVERVMRSVKIGRPRKAMTVA